MTDDRCLVDVLCLLSSLGSSYLLIVDIIQARYGWHLTTTADTRNE